MHDEGAGILGILLRASWFFHWKKKNPPAQTCIAGFRAAARGKSSALQM
jgi:hypothetical protein